MNAKTFAAVALCSLFLAGCSAETEVDLGGVDLGVAAEVPVLPVPAPAPSPLRSRTSYGGRKLAQALVDASKQLVDTGGLGLPNPVTTITDNLPVDVSVNAPVLKPDIADVDAGGLGLAGVTPVPAPAPAPSPLSG